MNSNESLTIGFFAGVIMMSLLHGIFLASVFMFFRQFSSKANKFLALSIFSVCVILAYEFVYWMDMENQVPLWIQYLPLYLRTPISLGVYFYVTFLIQPGHRLSRFDKVGFVLFGLELMLDLAYIPVNILVVNAEQLASLEFYLGVSGWFLSLFAAVIFLPKALQKVNSYQKLLFQNYSTTSDKSLGWLRMFLLLTLILVSIGILSFVQYVLGYWEASEFTFTLVTVGLVLLLFWIGYSIIFKHSWFRVAPVPEEKEPDTHKLSSKTDAYHRNLLSLMDGEKLFVDPELTLESLSQRLNISSGYLSQIINEKEGKNFFEFINTYRVEAVKEKLWDAQFHNYTIFGIAMESGFKSKSTFNSVFKKITGQTPSAFKKNLS